VKRSAVLLVPGSEVHGLEQGRVGEEAAVGDGGVDAGHVHADDAAGAEVEVADLGIAHLAVGEADEVLAGAEEGVGEVAQEPVVDRFAGLGYGVAVGLGAVAPAVEDGEDDGFGHAEVRIARVPRLRFVERWAGRYRGLSTAVEMTACLRLRLRIGASRLLNPPFPVRLERMGHPVVGAAEAWRVGRVVGCSGCAGDG